jgi:hypothetical protein
MEKTFSNTTTDFSKLSITPIHDTTTTPASRDTIMDAASTKTANIPSFCNEIEWWHDEGSKDLESMTIEELRDALGVANRKIRRLTASHIRQAKNNKRLQERYEHVKADNSKASRSSSGFWQAIIPFTAFMMAIMVGKGRLGSTRIAI